MAICPMVFHIRFALGRRTNSKFFDDKSIFLIKFARIQINLQGIQPDVFRRNLTSKLKQSSTNSLILAIRMHIELIDKFILHSHKSNGMLISFYYKDVIFFQDVVTKVILVFIKEVTLGILKFRK